MMRIEGLGRMETDLRLGQARPIFFPRLRARIKVSSVSRRLDKFVTKVKKVCDAAPQIRLQLEEAKRFSRAADALEQFERADTLLNRFERVFKGCQEGSEVPISKARADVKDTRREEFLDHGRACNTQVGIVTKSTQKQRDDWVACMQGKGWTQVTRYLKTKDREEVAL